MRSTNQPLIGVDLGGTNVRAGRVRSGELEAVEARRIPAGGSVDEVMKAIGDVIDAVWTADVAALGIGVPSVVDVETGVVYDVQNIPSWTEVPVQARLEARYDRPVRVNNDANCFALGEYYFGQGKGHDDMIGLIVGTGFAGGVILGGRLYSGPNCGAGEFGMMPYLDGVYEDYCSGPFFERAYATPGAVLFERAQAGGEDALAAFDAFGRHLGQALKAILYAYDPTTIVLGGSVRKAYRFYRDAAWEVLDTFAYRRSLARLTITVSDRDHVGVLGAAALPLDAGLVESPSDAARP